MNAEPLIGADSLMVDSLVTDTSVVVPVAQPEEGQADSLFVMMDSLMKKGGYFSYLNPTNSRRVVSGVQVEDCPYTLGNDRYVSLLVLVVLVVYLFVLSRNRAYLKERLSQLFGHRKHYEYTNIQQQKEFHGTFFFQIVSVFVWAVFGFCFLHAYYPHVVTVLEPLKVGACVFIISSVTFLLQKMLYVFVNWIFFDKKKRSEWSGDRNLLLTLEGLLLFPAILLLLYSPIEVRILWGLIVILLIFLRFYLMIRTFLIFFGKFYDGLHLILYFCTLEAMPLFFWGVALYELQENWKVII
jgi:hypothetical protein